MPTDINVLFSDFDKNKDGILCDNELRDALLATKLIYSPRSLSEFRGTINRDGYNDLSAVGLTEEEFTRFVKFYRGKFQAVFEANVAKGNGITRNSIENISSTLGITVTPDQMDSLLAVVRERERSGIKLTAMEFSSVLASIVACSSNSHSTLRIRESSESQTPDSTSLSATADAVPTSITLISGAIAGMTSRTLTAPLDRIKSLLQASVTSDAPTKAKVLPNYVRDYHNLGALKRWSFFHGFRMSEFYNTLLRSLFPRVRNPRAQMNMELVGVGWTVQETQAPRSRVPSRSPPITRNWRSFLARYRRRIAFFMNSFRLSNSTKAASRPSTTVAGHSLRNVMKASNPVSNAAVNIPLGNSGQPLQANTVRQCITLILKDGGVTAFWRGNGANVIKVMPESAVRFGAYEKLRTMVARDPQRLTVGESFVAGAGAGAMAQITIYPLELIKTRMALASTGQYNGIADCFRSVLQREGPRGLYRGLSASLVGMLPYSGVDLTVFSLLKRKHKEKHPTKEPNVPTLLLFGATATTVGQVFAYPFQLVRTRLQAQGMANRPILYNGIMDCLRKSYAAEGVRGLYKGMLPNMAKGIPAVAISFATFEVSKRTLLRFCNPDQVHSPI